MAAIKQRKGPERTCSVCGLKSSKKKLLRFVWQDGSVVADAGQRQPGRGAYCCDGECLQLFLQSRKKWKRLFRLG